MSHTHRIIFSLLLCIPTCLLSMRLREPESILLTEPIKIKPLYTTNQNFTYYVWNAQNSQVSRYKTIFPEKYIESVCPNEDKPEAEIIELLFERTTSKKTVPFYSADETSSSNEKEHQAVFFFSKTQNDIAPITQVINTIMKQDGWNLKSISHEGLLEK